MTLLAGLLAALALGALLELLHLLAQFFDVGQRLFDGLIVLAGGFAVLAFLRKGLLDALQLVAETVQALSNAGLGHDRVFAQTAAKIVGVALHIAGKLGLLHFTERLTQLAGRFALCAGQIADGFLHLLFQILEGIDFALAAVSELPGLLLVRAVLGIAKSTPQLAFKVLLLAGNLVGLLREVIDLIVGLLVPETGQGLLGFLQSFGSALGFGFALRGSRLLGRSRLAHTLQRLL